MSQQEKDEQPWKPSTVLHDRVRGSIWLAKLLKSRDYIRVRVGRVRVLYKLTFKEPKY